MNQSQAYLVLKEITTLLRPEEAHLIAGTLLGYGRNKDFIPGDLDIDLGLFDYNWKKVEQITDKVKKSGFKLMHHFGTIQQGYSQAIIKDDIKIDLVVVYTGNQYYKASWGSKKQDIWLMNKEVHEPYKLTEGVFGNGIKVLVPDNIERVLTEHYGERWRLPWNQKHPGTKYNYFNDAKNIVRTNNTSKMMPG